MDLKQVTFKFLGIQFSFTPNDLEREAAWSLYVELKTRIAMRPFAGEYGLMRGALDSLYSLFPTTREVLRNAGPKVASSHNSLGFLAMKMLNEEIAPFTNEWHHKLEDYEAKRTDDLSRLEHEKNWKWRDDFVNELEKLQKKVSQYADALALVAGIEEEFQPNKVI